MIVLIWSLVLFGLAFLLHVIVWKVRLPGRQTKTLLIIMFGALGAGLLVLYAAPQASPALSGYVPHGLPRFIHIALFFTSFTLAYMITYSAIEADSPTLVMVAKIAGAGEKGLSKDAFDSALTDELLVTPRVRDLITDRMAVIEGGRYRLTPKGLFMARLFIFHRGVLRLGKGG